MEIDGTFIKDFIQRALYEDVRDGDHTSLACIGASSRSQAVLRAKDTGVIAGVELAKEIFDYADKRAEVEVLLHDGAAVMPGDVVLRVRGNTRALLMAERLVLNLMQRMSGIATMTRQYTQAVEGLPVRLLDTRKTTPLIRFVEKWAVAIGGGENYRFGLYDRFMVKDNHLDACGGIQTALTRVASYAERNNLALPVTVEVRNFEEVAQVLTFGKGRVNRVMFDNFSVDDLRHAVAMVGSAFETEASGGITLQNLRIVAETGVNFISVGALTHSFKSLDLSLKILREAAGSENQF